MVVNSNTLLKSLSVSMIFCNIYAFIVLLSTGRLDTSYPGHYLHNPEVAVISILFIISFYFFIYFAFIFGTRLPNRKKIKRVDGDKVGLKKLSLIVVALQLIYIYAILIEGAGSAGGVVSESQTIVSSFLTLFRVDDFALLFMLCYANSPYFRLNFGLYFISFILRGWLSVLISGLIIIIVRRSKNIKPLKIVPILLFLLLMMVLFPFLMLIRNELRLSDDYLAAFGLINYSDFWIIDIFAGVHGILMRFQQMESLVYFIQNLQIFQNLYDRNLITPVYFDGPFVSGLFKRFHGVSSEPLGLILADQSRDLVTGRKSAVSPGLITYLFLDFFSIFYIIIVPILYGYVTTFFARSSQFSIGCFYFLIFYFSFGWSNAVLGSFFSIVIFLITSRFFIFSKRKKFEPKLSLM